MLRWKRFVQGDEDVWAANTKKFTQATGIEVRVDAEGWEDVRPEGGRRRERRQRTRHHHQHDGRRASVSRQAGRCHRRRQLPRQQVRRLVRRIAKAYGMHGKKWVAIMMGAAGNAHGLSRELDEGRRLRHVSQGHARFSQALPGAEGKGHAGRLRARQRDRRLELDALAGVGSRREAGRRKEQGRHQQPGDDRRARVRASSSTRPSFPERCPGSTRTTTRRSSTASSIVTANGISIYYAAKTSPDPKLQEMAKDIQHAAFPLGRRRQARGAEPRVPDDDLQVLQVSECGQGIPALHDGTGAVRSVAGGVDRIRLPSARGLRVEPVLDRRRQEHAVPRLHEEHDVRTATREAWATRRRPRMADFIIPNMVAEAASGSKTPKEAAERAQQRAERYYKV